MAINQAVITRDTGTRIGTKFSKKASMLKTIIKIIFLNSLKRIINIRPILFFSEAEKLCGFSPYNIFSTLSLNKSLKGLATIETTRTKVKLIMKKEATEIKAMASQ